MESPGFGLQLPRQPGPGLEAAQPALDVVGESGHFRVVLTAHQVVPAGREMPRAWCARSQLGFAYLQPHRRVCLQIGHPLGDHRMHVLQ